MASKIRELRDSLVEQTEMIRTLRADRDSTKDIVKALYMVLVKFRPEFLAQTEGFSELEYPSLRAEEVTKLPNAEMVKNIGVVFRVITSSVEQMSGEIKAMYKELDQSVDGAVEQWRVVRAQESNQAKAQTFRDPLATNTENKRAPTPEVPLVNRTRVDGATAPSTALGGTTSAPAPKPASPTDSKKGNGKKLGDVVNGLKGTSPTPRKT